MIGHSIAGSAYGNIAHKLTDDLQRCYSTDTLTNTWIINKEHTVIMIGDDIQKRNEDRINKMKQMY